MNQTDKEKKEKTGTLYIVATPIGNLNDITLRALEILKQVDLILAEDTRVTAKLLSHFGIQKKLISYHHHNEKSRIDAIETDLLDGQSIALVSDAGTPLISDPGYVIVHYLRQKGFPVVPIPGASAMITALSAAGVTTDKFQFVGFLSSKNQVKLNELNKLQSYDGISVLYEAPHRLIATLDAIESVMLKTHNVVLVKELTKQYETFVEGNAVDIKNWLLDDPYRQKGEFVLLLAPLKEKTDKENNDESLEKTLNILLKELPLKQAVTITASLLDLKKNKVYDYALALNKANQANKANKEKV